MGGISDIKEDLPVAMTMAAFIGIAWYIAIELNIRLFFLFRRRRGLYFWSCALCSWGVLIQPLTILLADFQVVTNLYVSIILIYLSWWIMVIPQSLVLYSRLHLVMRDAKHLRWVLYMIIFTTIVFSIPTIILGVIAQASSQSATLGPINLIWDRIQLTVFFVQETIISALYVALTWRHLKNFPLFGPDESKGRQVMKHLIYANLVVIFLDVSLLAIQYANFFYIQGAYKPCVYGVKLRVEFAILNRLISSIQQTSRPSYNNRSDSKPGGIHLKPSSQRSGTQMLDRDVAEYHNSSLESSLCNREGIVHNTEISIEPIQQKTPH